MDKGLFIISGKLSEGVKLEKAEEAIINELDKIKKSLVSSDELKKVKNKIESTLIFSEISVLNKAMKTLRLLNLWEVLTWWIGK